MSVKLTDEVRWINQCYPHEDEHEHVSLYLIQDEEHRILIDSGSFYHLDEIKSQIEAETETAGADVLILSHSDYPHAGNIGAFRREWGDIDLIASSGSPQLQGLEDARRCEIGGQMEICGRQFHFIDPPLADRSHTTWIFDEESGVLFTADGFGNYHQEGQCNYTSGSYPDGTPEDAIKAYHEDNLVWLRYVEPAKLEKAISRIFAEFDVSYIAPAHGNPIEGPDVDRYFDKLLDAASEIADEYTVPQRA